MAKEKKTIAQELSERKAKKTNPLLYWILARLWKALYYKKLGISVTYKYDHKKLKGSYIVVSNHASRLDYIYTGIPLLPHQFTYVAGYNEFFRSHLQGIFKVLNNIPKRNFVSDVHTIKEMSRILKKRKGRVVLFPEGMSSIGGANQPVALGSGKLLKHFNLPVLMTKIKGGYLTSTKYNLEERCGKVEVEVDLLFTPQQLEQMTEEEIQDKLNSALYHDDYLWNKEARVKYKSKEGIAVNMHHLLYRCPKCQKEFVMKSEKDKIFCTHCGNGAFVNEYYDLIPFDENCVIPATPKVWYDWQRDKVREEIKNEDFALKENVKLGMLPDYKFLENLATSNIVGEGELTLDKNGLTYKGTKDGSSFEMNIPAEKLPTYGMCTDVTRFYTFVKGIFYEFYPQGETVCKWLFATEEMHRLKGGKWKDFKKA